MRPVTLDDYITSPEVKNIISLSIKASKIKGKSFPHTIITGPPGTGKTTLAMIIAREMNNESKLYELLAPSIKSPQILINTFLKCKTGDVVFIDEIHSLDDKYEEILYTIIEDNKLIMSVMGKSIMYEIPNITIIGATTDPSKVSTPLYDRFKQKIQLQKYTHQDMYNIISSYISRFITHEPYNIMYTSDAIDQLVYVSRGTPRVALSYVDTSIDYALVNNVSIMDHDHIINTLHLLGIDKNGLNKVDRHIIMSIYDNGDAMSIDTLSSIIGYSKQDISSMYEPYLIESGYIAISGKGRVLNQKGYDYISEYNKNGGDT